MNLNSIGYSDFFKNQVKDNECVGRISKAFQNNYTIITEDGFKVAGITGKMEFKGEFPKIGDFVLYSKSGDNSYYSIYNILERKSIFSRKEAGQKSNEQILAANIDYIFILMSLNDDFNLRRIERYLIAAWESKAEPIVILTKKDICDDLDDKLLLLKDVALGVEIIPISAITGYKIKELNKYNKKGNTIVFVGSSGVGKSTLINILSKKEIMNTGEIRLDDSRGKHTTTHRELVISNDEACLIDTPGIREFSIYNGEIGIYYEFSDIEKLSKKCRFSDCEHKNEPGCVVIEKINSGELSVERYQSYLNLKKEIFYQEKKRKKQEKIVTKKNEKYKRKSKPRNKKWII